MVDAEGFVQISFFLFGQICATIWLNINSELHQSGTQIDAIMKTEDRELFSKVRKKKKSRMQGGVVG